MSVRLAEVWAATPSRPIMPWYSRSGPSADWPTSASASATVLFSVPGAPETATFSGSVMLRRMVPAVMSPPSMLVKKSWPVVPSTL